ncbi:MAG: tetratricopeptide repeat protein [Acidobacteria bacterium]|nr:tetratricopeptide repeat protein [Acidobacteriota bacterium]
MEMGIRARTGITKAHSGAPSRNGRLIPALAIVALTSFPLAGQSTHTTVRRHRIEDSSREALAKAETAIDKGNYGEAEPLLRQVVAAHPENYTAWYDLGFVYHQQGERDKSIAAYRQSVAANPNVFESNLNLGIALAEAANPDAEAFLRAATQLKPSSEPNRGYKRAWLALGQVLAKTNSDAALDAFERAALADDKDPEPHLLAGSLLERKQKPAEAEKEYQRALALNPSSPDVLAALTDLDIEQHRLNDAESLLRKLVVVRPDDAGAHLQLGRLLVLLGKKDEAIAEMETGLKLDPSNSHGRRDLADFYSDAGKYGEAERLYSSLLSATPGDPALHYGLGKCLLKQKKFPSAEQELRQAVALRPDFGQAYGELAIAADGNKDYLLAIQATDLRAKYLPETPMSYFLRATAYDHLRDIKQAARYYHQFLTVASGNYPEQEWQAKHRLIAIEPKK